MGFKQGAIAYIKSVEQKGTYTNAHILISKKLKDGAAKYCITFSGYANFYGKAHEQRPLQGQKIRLGDVDVSNAYVDREGNQRYNKTPIFAIYTYELLQTQEERAQNSPSIANFDDLADGSDMPF